MTDFAISGLLFDCDGVLVDSIEAAAVAWDRWSAVWAPSFDFRRDIVHGRRAGDTVAELVEESDRAEAEEQLVGMEIDTVAGTIEIPGAAALLKSLPVDKFSVVTSGMRELALARLAATGMPRVANLVAAEDVSHGKPHPEPYRKGAKLVGENPANCVVFEDAPAGIQAAFDAGIGTIIGVGVHALGTQATLVVPDLRAVTWSNGTLTVDDSLVLG